MCSQACTEIGISEGCVHLMLKALPGEQTLSSVCMGVGLTASHKRSELMCEGCPCIIYPESDMLLQLTACKCLSTISLTEQIPFWHTQKHYSQKLGPVGNTRKWIPRPLFSSPFLLTELSCQLILRENALQMKGAKQIIFLSLQIPSSFSI